MLALPDVLIRNVSKEVLATLKQRAAAKGRSLQVELHKILEEAAGENDLDGVKMAADIRKKLLARGKSYSDSVELIREDRER
ncbi:FitA-like ribbon-helix-helix domain-containing protein [Neomoorella humiferrea]|uniref:FitA-like ribbon-helix-helix domain-containing protein n=1 Tax=Neomoorella humiferrea TaxID=676965 RepID=UPI003BF5E49E